MITKNYIAKGEGADRFEKVPVQIYDKPSEAVKAVAVKSRTLSVLILLKVKNVY